MRVDLVIPAYNEENRIDKILPSLDKLRSKVFIVDDGSIDKTSLLINEFLASHRSSKFFLISHKINLGKGAALKTGAEAAFLDGAEAVVIMDSDGQHKAEDLPKFLNKISKGRFDIVFGSRNFDLGTPLVRFIGNKFASILVSILFGIYVSDLICGYRAFTKQAYNKLYWRSLGYGVETEMVVNTAKNKLKYCEVPIMSLYHDRFKGVTILDAFGIFFDLFKWRLTK